MTMDAEGGGGPLNRKRQITIDALCEHFANDAITVEDFESRIDLAHAANTADELRELLRDLPSGDLPVVAGSSTHPVPGREGQLAPSDHSKQNGYAVAVLGGSRRRGRWSPAAVTHSVAVLGGVELDFREAQLPPGVTEIKAYSIMGGIEIIVPPGLNVESHGIGILGAFEHAADDVQLTDPNAPVLRISGIALMGGVDIKVRHPGETAGDARRRRRQERRDRRRRLRGRVKDAKEDVRPLSE